MDVTPFEGSDAEWDAFVAEAEGATYAHLSAWKRVLGEVFGHETFQWAAVDEGGGLRGVLPLARVKSRVFGDYLLSMPFVSYGGPIGASEAVVALAEKATEEAARLGVDLLELRNRVDPPVDLQLSSRKITVTKALPETAEELWEKGIKSKVRSQIRRPMKEGMEARFGLDLVDAFYDVFARTMRDLGTPVLPRSFFHALSKEFPSQLVVSVIESGGDAVAAGCGFAWGGEFEITWAGALREYSAQAPNMLLYWSLMEHSVERGLETFNFGRCSPGSGTHRFKRQWGGEDEPLPWRQWSADGIAATPNPESAKYRMAISAWQRLPVPIANVIGPLLSRSLP